MNLLESCVNSFSCWIQTTFVFNIYIGQCLHWSSFQSAINVVSVTSPKIIVSMHYLHSFPDIHMKNAEYTELCGLVVWCASPYCAKKACLFFVYNVSWKSPNIFQVFVLCSPMRELRDNPTIPSICCRKTDW